MQHIKRDQPKATRMHVRAARASRAFAARVHARCACSGPTDSQPMASDTSTHPCMLTCKRVLQCESTCVAGEARTRAACVTSVLYTRVVVYRAQRGERRHGGGEDAVASVHWEFFNIEEMVCTHRVDSARTTKRSSQSLLGLAVTVARRVRQGQCCIFSSTAVIAMNEKRIHPKTAMREAKADAKKEERVGSVMHEINEQFTLHESINAPWPPRASTSATFSRSPSSTLLGIRATCQSPDLKDLMQLTSWIMMLTELMRTQPNSDSWYLAARARAILLLQCKERQWHEIQTGATNSDSMPAPNLRADAAHEVFPPRGGFGERSAEDGAARWRDFAPSL